jgi:hypothetical protein
VVQHDRELQLFALLAEPHQPPCHVIPANQDRRVVTEPPQLLADGCCREVLGKAARAAAFVGVSLRVTC